MITDDEVLRLFERADPAQTDDAAPAIDAAGYLDALRTRSSNVHYIDTEPTPTEPPTNHHHRWLAAAAAAATVAVIAGGLVLAARDDDETGVVSDPGRAAELPPVTEGPVTTPPPPSDEELAAIEGVETRVGFIGLPPEGATPSIPEGGEIVVWVGSCGTPAVHGEWIIELSEIDRLPPLAELYVLADGRLIWQKYEDLPEGANSLSTGLLEQRLTPEGVELMRSEANAALSSGEPQHCGTTRRNDIHDVTVVGSADWYYLSDDNQHLARVMDPWSWLPANAWEDPEIKAYVPSTYLVAFAADFQSGDEQDEVIDDLAAQLPAAVADLLDTKQWDRAFAATFTTDEAHALAAALDDAGLEQDGLSNAYQLDYEYEYRDGSGDTVVHIVFSVFDLWAMFNEAPPFRGDDQPPQTEPLR